MISDAAYELMDDLFFVILFSELEKVVDFAAPELVSLLGELLREGWVDQLQIPRGKLDYEKLNRPDFENIQEYDYLATKKGLLAYNGVSI